MKLYFRGAEFDKATVRKDFVMFLSATVEGKDGRDFKPYKANENDDRNWILDSANNWRVNFLEGDKTEIDLRYRYQCETVKAEEALAAWLEFRAGASKMPNERANPASAAGAKSCEPNANVG